MSQRDSHESYAMVGFGRCCGNPGPLFGAIGDSHEVYIKLSIKRATVSRSGTEFESTGPRGELIEVDMTEPQFAQLLSSLNVGNGSPCTLRYFGGERVPDPPQSPSLSMIRDELMKTKREHVDAMRVQLEQMRELLATNTCGPSHRLAIQTQLERVVDLFDDTAQDMIAQFDRYASRIVAER